MTDQELFTLCAIRQSNIDTRETLVAEIETLTEKIGTELGSRGVRSVDLGEYVPQLVVSTRHTLDKIALVEAGVPLGTIEACTKESTSEGLRVTRRKAKG